MKKNHAATGASFVGLLVVGGWVGGCASVSPPTGGERDTTAPKLLTTVPIDGSIRFGGREIRLVFSEPVKADQLGELLTITPEGDLGQPLVTAKDNELALKFSKPFAPNTTYSLDFGDAIGDITENNKAETVKLHFSTGTFIDSGRVQGKLLTLLQAAPVAQALVSLYAVGSSEPDSVTPALAKPTYRVKTDAGGAFAFQNIRPDRYRLFAFADANKNKQYDEPELIGYWPEVLTVGPQADSSLVLRAGRLDTRPPFLAKRQERDGALELQFNEGVRQLEVALLESNRPATGLTFRPEKTTGREFTVFGKPRSEPVRLLVTGVDSAGNRSTDTLRVKFAGPAVAPNPKPLVALITYLPTTSDKPYEVRFPVRLQNRTARIGRFEAIQADTSKVKGAAGTVPAPELPLLLGTTARFDSSRSVLLVSLPITKGKPAVAYNLLLDSTALIAETGAMVSGRPLRLPVPAEQSSGSITVLVRPSQPSYAIELVQGGTVVRRYEHWRGQPAGAPKAVTWDALPPGKYQLRALIDADNDGQWRAGDPAFRLAPEPVVRYQAELDVRTNWEQEVTFAF